MKTILVDDEPLTMQSFQRHCEADNNFDIAGVFTDPLEALEYAKHNRVDFALLDVDMPKMNGIDLSVELRKYYPEMIVIFVTAHEHYILPTLRAKSDYFITKPYSVEDVVEALSRASLLSNRIRKPVFIRAFGNFDVFLNDKPIHFSSAKAKELLALLVNERGGTLSTMEAAALIWEDAEPGRDDCALCRTAAMRLRKTLAEHGIEYILTETTAGRYVNKETFDCDYYLYLQGIKSAERAFTGEYMTQYSWAEVTLSHLLDQSKQSKNERGV